ncbi:regulator of chromosome condensation (RCC1) repeat-containing protein [Toxoplasma gondii GT1]|uniref:Regulator of chromosome condensation (RCC1) repeat-containing protein n=5 Tax=Toxoplasma gondii TaxID=5811 RepID=S7UR29_TOXGG|nr:regulator of chromosome condensation (RCC1) repeat-containing protein [Toxoplasma gondii GT1]KAF4643463.1 regulator of chromosome condensation (RCC1) repeat-containing protein [Toxoplasma gondii]RQX70773.1 regulator of chromosome condensation (RCC1) repeat-containing protein [Toxoplasma gondii CAST]
MGQCGAKQNGRSRASGIFRGSRVSSNSLQGFPVEAGDRQHACLLPLPPPVLHHLTVSLWSCLLFNGSGAHRRMHWSVEFDEPLAPRLFSEEAEADWELLRRELSPLSQAERVKRLPELPTLAWFSLFLYYEFSASTLLHALAETLAADGGGALPHTGGERGSDGYGPRRRPRSRGGRGDREPYCRDWSEEPGGGDKRNRIDACVEERIVDLSRADIPSFPETLGRTAGDSFPARQASSDCKCTREELREREQRGEALADQSRERQTQRVVDAFCQWSRVMYRTYLLSQNLSWLTGIVAHALTTPQLRRLLALALYKYYTEERPLLGFKRPRMHAKVDEKAREALSRIVVEQLDSEPEDTPTNSHSKLKKDSRVERDCGDVSGYGGLERVANTVKEYVEGGRIDSDALHLDVLDWAVTGFEYKGVVFVLVHDQDFWSAIRTEVRCCQVVRAASSPANVRLTSQCGRLCAVEGFGLRVLASPLVPHCVEPIEEPLPFTVARDLLLQAVPSATSGPAVERVLRVPNPQNLLSLYAPRFQARASDSSAYAAVTDKVMSLGPPHAWWYFAHLVAEASPIRRRWRRFSTSRLPSQGNTSHAESRAPGTSTEEACPLDSRAGREMRRRLLQVLAACLHDAREGISRRFLYDSWVVHQAIPTPQTGELGRLLRARPAASRRTEREMPRALQREGEPASEQEREQGVGGSLFNATTLGTERRGTEAPTFVKEYDPRPTEGESLSNLPAFALIFDGTSWTRPTVVQLKNGDIEAVLNRAATLFGCTRSDLLPYQPLGETIGEEQSEFAWAFGRKCSIWTLAKGPKTGCEPPFRAPAPKVGTARDYFQVDTIERVYPSLEPCSPASRSCLRMCLPWSSSQFVISLAPRARPIRPETYLLFPLLQRPQAGARRARGGSSETGGRRAPDVQLHAPSVYRRVLALLRRLPFLRHGGHLRKILHHFGVNVGVALWVLWSEVELRVHETETLGDLPARGTWRSSVEAARLRYRGDQLVRELIACEIVATAVKRVVRMFTSELPDRPLPFVYALEALLPVLFRPEVWWRQVDKLLPNERRNTRHHESCLMVALWLSVLEASQVVAMRPWQLVAAFNSVLQTARSVPTTLAHCLMHALNVEFSPSFLYVISTVPEASAAEWFNRVHAVVLRERASAASPSAVKERGSQGQLHAERQLEKAPNDDTCVEEHGEPGTAEKADVEDDARGEVEGDVHARELVEAAEGNAMSPVNASLFSRDDDALLDELEAGDEDSEEQRERVTTYVHALDVAAKRLLSLDVKDLYQVASMLVRAHINPLELLPTEEVIATELFVLQGVQEHLASLHGDAGRPPFGFAQRFYRALPTRAAVSFSSSTVRLRSILSSSHTLTPPLHSLSPSAARSSLPRSAASPSLPPSPSPSLPPSPSPSVPASSLPRSSAFSSSLPASCSPRLSSASSAAASFSRASSRSPHPSVVQDSDAERRLAPSPTRLESFVERLLRSNISYAHDSALAHSRLLVFRRDLEREARASQRESTRFLPLPARLKSSCFAASRRFSLLRSSNSGLTARPGAGETEPNSQRRRGEREEGSEGEETLGGASAGDATEKNGFPEVLETVLQGKEVEKQMRQQRGRRAEDAFERKHGGYEGEGTLEEETVFAKRIRERLSGETDAELGAYLTPAQLGMLDGCSLLHSLSEAGTSSRIRTFCAGHTLVTWTLVLISQVSLDEEGRRRLARRCAREVASMESAYLRSVFAPEIEIVISLLTLRGLVALWSGGLGSAKELFLEAVLRLFDAWGDPRLYGGRGHPFLLFLCWVLTLFASLQGDASRLCAFASIFRAARLFYPACPLAVGPPRFGPVGLQTRHGRAVLSDGQCTTKSAPRPGAPGGHNALWGRAAEDSRGVEETGESQNVNEAMEKPGQAEGGDNAVFEQFVREIILDKFALVGNELEAWILANHPANAITFNQTVDIRWNPLENAHEASRQVSGVQDALATDAPLMHGVDAGVIHFDSGGRVPKAALAGRVLAFGSNVAGQLGLGLPTAPASPRVAPASERRGESEPSSAGERADAVSESDARAFDEAAERGVDVWWTPQPSVVHALKDAHVTASACGFYHSAAVDIAGGLWTWGSNAEGQIGAQFHHFADVPRGNGAGPAVSWTSVAAESPDWSDFDNPRHFALFTQENVSPVSALTPRKGAETPHTGGASSASAKEDEVLKTRRPSGVTFFGDLGCEAQDRREPEEGARRHSLQFHNLSEGAKRYAVTASLPTPVAISSAPATRFTQVACGRDFTVALTTDGLLFSWGSNRFGCLGTSDFCSRSTPEAVDMSEFSVAVARPSASITVEFERPKITEIRCGPAQCAALSDEQGLWVWGRGASGQLGLSPAYLAMLWRRPAPSALGSTSAVAAPDRWLDALDAEAVEHAFDSAGDGEKNETFAEWRVDSEARGEKQRGQETHAEHEKLFQKLQTSAVRDGCVATPTRLRMLQFCDLAHFQAKMEEWNLWTEWRQAFSLVTLRRTAPRETLIAAIPDDLLHDLPTTSEEVLVSDIAFGNAHTVCLDISSNLLTWGHGGEGQLAVESACNGQILHAQPAPSEAGLRAVHEHAVVRPRTLGRGLEKAEETGAKETFALTEETVVSAAPTPARLTACFHGRRLTRGKRTRAIAAGGDTSAAVDEDGAIWVWGSNANGLLGRPLDQKEHFLPHKLTVDGKAVSACISPDGRRLAVCTDTGELWMWGRESLGSLGRSAAAPYWIASPPDKEILHPKPETVPLLNGYFVTAVSLGVHHTLVLSGDPERNALYVRPPSGIPEDPPELPRRPLVDVLSSPLFEELPNAPRPSQPQQETQEDSPGHRTRRGPVVFKNVKGTTHIAFPQDLDAANLSPGPLTKTHAAPTSEFLQRFNTEPPARPSPASARPSRPEK